MYSWQVVGQVSLKVEPLLTKVGLKKKHYLFLIRGAYPFYTGSTIVMWSYFYYYMDQEF